MTQMTELEAWKLIYAWARTVPASADPQFKEARTAVRKFIKRVEKANSDSAAAWRLIHQGMTEQGHVLVCSASADEVRRLVKMKTGGQELPAGYAAGGLVRPRLLRPAERGLDRRPVAHVQRTCGEGGVAGR